MLAGDALVDPLTIATFVGAGLLLWRTELNSGWLIVGGATLGIIHTGAG